MWAQTKLDISRPLANFHPNHWYDHVHSLPSYDEVNKSFLHFHVFFVAFCVADNMMYFIWVCWFFCLVLRILLMGEIFYKYRCVHSSRSKILCVEWRKCFVLMIYRILRFWWVKFWKLCKSIIQSQEIGPMLWMLDLLPSNNPY